MADLTIDYYLTMNSPWSYLGAGRLRAIADKAGCRVNVFPAKFVEVFSSTGGLPLGKRAPERQSYRLAELRRWSEFLGVPVIAEPAHFPGNDRLAAHAVIAAQEKGLDALCLSLELGRAQWEMEQDFGHMETVAAACLRSGIDVNLLGDLESYEQQFAANTMRAIKSGVFGFPSYLVDGEMFWGQDRLDFLQRKLGVVN